jgi:outer membrane lipoprotein-sorting protein
MKLLASFLGGMLVLSGMLAGIPAAGQAPADLNKVLELIDRTAPNYRTVQADFRWNQYTAVVREDDWQGGVLSFARNGKGIAMRAEIVSPAKKTVISNDGKLQIHQPGTDSCNEYDLGKNKAAVESFLALGFGGTSRELKRSFTVGYGGTEMMKGVETYKLELDPPKGSKAAELFTHITLWIDKTRGVSVMQKFYQQGGDYRLAVYSNIKGNVKLDDSLFKLKGACKRG